MTFPRYLDLAGLRWNFVASYCRQVSSVLQSLFKKPQHLKLVADYSTILSSYRVFPQTTKEIRWQITCHKACTTRIFFFQILLYLMATIFCLTKQSRTALRLCCCFLKVILADGLFLFLFTCTAQDNNKVGRVLSSHNFLIVFGKRRIVRYWSTGVRWCKRDVPLFSKPCQEF